MKIVWILPKDPFPADDGSKRAMEAILIPLSKLCDVHVIILDRMDSVSSKDFIIKEWGIKTLTRLKTKASSSVLSRIVNAVKSFFIPLPFTYIPYGNEELSISIDKVIKKVKADFVICDTLHACLPILRLNIPFIHRSHNVESLIWTRMANQRRNVILKWFLSYQAKKIERLEFDVHHKANQTFCISEVDRDVAQESFKIKKFNVLPVGFPVFEANHSQKNQLSLLFLGKLDWKPNQEGLRWFLENVFHEIKNNKFILNIVGSGNGEWLGPYLNHKNIQFHGRVDKVDPYYLDADLVISPIFFGSGVRIKLLESAAFNRTFITTSQGVEGTQFKSDSYFLANNTESWIKTLSSISLKDVVVKEQKLFNFVNEHYSSLAIAEKFLNELKNNK